MNSKKLLNMFKCINKSVSAAALVLGMFTTPASAILVEADLVFGSNDGFITRDTNTGLEWLDLTLTHGQSYNSVAGGFGGFTTDLGFSFADLTQVSTLFDNAGISVIGGFTLANVSPVTTLIGLLGRDTGNGNASINAFGLYGEPDAASNVRLATLSSLLPPSAPRAIAFLGPSARDVSNSNDAFASFLIRERVSPVPLPPASLLFGAGLVVLAALRRRANKLAQA